MAEPERWWVKGLMFENCNCQLLCPGHLSFRQRCTHERCTGFWAFHIDEGRQGTVALGGLNAVIVCSVPQVMISGEWTQAIYLDERSDETQRRALEMIFTGQAGGPWGILAQFVATRLETRYVPIHLRDEGRWKELRIEGLLESSVEAMKGADRGGEAVLENVWTRIHAPTQVLAFGTTRYADQGLSLDTTGSHALYCRFSWTGP